MKDQEAALMYSGGVDTTYMALRLAEDYSKVHLLTFCNGFCVRSGASQKNVFLLKKRFGNDKFRHAIVSSSAIFNSLKEHLLKDMFKYRTPLLVDLCCRLSMEVATISYCLDNNIKYVAAGSNPNTQGEIFIQQEQYLDAVRNFFSQYGIEYLYSYKFLDKRKEIIKSLESAGIKTGIKSLENIGIGSHLFTQPFCLWAPVVFFFTSNLRKIPFVRHFNLSTENAIRIRLEKEKLAKIIIEKQLVKER